MNVNLWYCESMRLWRWSVTVTNKPILIQESGQNENLEIALQEIHSTILILKD